MSSSNSRSERLAGWLLDEDLVGVEVHAQPAALEDLVRLRHVLAVGAAQHRLHARDQLAGTERLRDVVVGAHLEADHPVDLGRPGGEHDDGQLCVASALRRRRQTSRPSVPGNMMSSTTSAGSLPRNLGERALAGVGLPNGVAFLLEMEADELADVLLVLDHQDRSLDCH